MRNKLIKQATQPSFVSGFCLGMADYWSGLIPRYSSLGLTLSEGARGSLQLTIGPHQFEATQFENSQLKICNIPCSG